MSSIHSTAIVHPGAKLGQGCEIGPFCVLGEQVELGPGCRLHSHVVLDGHTRIGQRNEFFPFAVIGKKTQDLKWKGGVTRVEIGDENVFRESVTVHCATDDGDATVIGSNNLFLTYAHVAHDCVVGNHIIMSGYAGLAGHVVVEDYAILSGYAAVHQFCRIGKMAIVGGCSKVAQDIPPFMMADGNPARTRTINKVGMERRGIAEETITSLRQAYKILFRDGLTVTNALAKIEQELPDSPELQHLIQFARRSERGLGK
jgi:UDP-N-acetylglucosamine acyltransferase